MSFYSTARERLTVEKNVLFTCYSRACETRFSEPTVCKSLDLKTQDTDQVMEVNTHLNQTTPLSACVGCWKVETSGLTNYFLHSVNHTHTLSPRPLCEEHSGQFRKSCSRVSGIEWSPCTVLWSFTVNTTSEVQSRAGREERRVTEFTIERPLTSSGIRNNRVHELCPTERGYCMPTIVGQEAAAICLSRRRLLLCRSLLGVKSRSDNSCQPSVGVLSLWESWAAWEYSVVDVWWQASHLSDVIRSAMFYVFPWEP